MADLSRMETALRNAHAAGDTAAATKIAQALKSARNPQAERFDVAFDPSSDRPELVPQAAAAQQRADPRNSFLGKVDATVRGAADILSFGYADELAAAGDAAFQPLFGTGEEGGSFWERYEQNLRTQRGIDQSDEQNRFGYRLGGQVAGALPAAIIPASAAAQSAGLAGRIVIGALGGAAQGAAYGSGSAVEGERGQGAVKGLVAGGVVGGAVPVVGNAIGRAVGSRAGRAAVPTADELKGRAQSLYSAAEQQGLRIAPQSFGNAANAISREVRAKGIDPNIHPKAWAALQRVEQAAGGQLDLGEVETLRRVIGQAAKSNEPSERYMAGQMMRRLDDYMNNLKPSDVLAGDSRAAVGMIREARSLWSRQAKADVLTELWDRAGNRASQFSGSGFENALRTEFRNLIQNPKRLRMFTPDERRAIGKIARGGPIENFLRMAGKFAPTGVVSSVMSGGAGLAVGGPVGAVALPAVGLMARQGATAMTTRNYRNAEALVRNAGVQPFDAPLAALAAGRATPALDTLGRGVGIPTLLDLARTP